MSFLLYFCSDINAIRDVNASALSVPADGKYQIFKKFRKIGLLSIVRLKGGVAKSRWLR
jgi:hypothetical protein